MRLSIKTIAYRFLFVINRNGKFTLGNQNNGEREKGRVEGKMKKIKGSRYKSGPGNLRGKELAR